MNRTTNHLIADLDDVLLDPTVYGRWIKRCRSPDVAILPGPPATEFFVALRDGRARVACECPSHCTLFVEVAPGEWRWAAGEFN